MDCCRTVYAVWAGPLALPGLGACLIPGEQNQGQSGACHGDKLSHDFLLSLRYGPTVSWPHPETWRSLAWRCRPTWRCGRPGGRIDELIAGDLRVVVRIHRGKALA